MNKYSEEEVHKAFIAMIKHPEQHQELWEKVKKTLVKEKEKTNAYAGTSN